MVIDQNSFVNRKKDARLLYMIELARPARRAASVTSSRLPHGFELRTFICGNRDAFFAVEVMQKSQEAI